MGPAGVGWPGSRPAERAGVWGGVWAGGAGMSGEVRAGCNVSQCTRFRTALSPSRRDRRSGEKCPLDGPSPADQRFDRDPVRRHRRAHSVRPSRRRDPSLSFSVAVANSPPRDLICMGDASQRLAKDLFLLWRGEGTGLWAILVLRAHPHQNPTGTAPDHNTTAACRDRGAIHRGVLQHCSGGVPADGQHCPVGCRL